MEVGEEHEKTGTKPTTVIYRKVRKDGEEGRKIQDKRERYTLNLYRRGSKRKKAANLMNFRKHSMKEAGWCRRLRKEGPAAPLPGCCSAGNSLRFHLTCRQGNG